MKPFTQSLFLFFGTTRKIHFLTVLSALLISSVMLCACEDSGDEEFQPLTIEPPPGKFEFYPWDSETNLINGLWASYFSANAYAHYFYMGPALGELGFGAPVHHTEAETEDQQVDISEGQAWQKCAEAVVWMRGAEADQALPADYERWPYHCARRWWTSHLEGEGNIPVSYSAAFEKWLLQTVRLDDKIQFFYEGRLSDDGERFIRGSTQVLWVEHHIAPVVVVAFRGTEPNKWNDIVTDTNVFKTPFNPDDAAWGEIHSGFYKGFEGVIDQLEARAQGLLESGGNARLWITGHSLGGALATIMTAWLLEKMDKNPAWADFPLSGLITFGSPRVGNERFVSQFNAAVTAHGISHMRFVHGNDIVTRIPSFGFHHVGDTHYLGKSNDDECPTDAPCFVIREGDTGGAYLGSIGDHDISLYYNHILNQQSHFNHFND